MKKLSDYKGEEAIELWADLLDPVTAMLANPHIAEASRNGKSLLDIAKILLKENASDVEAALKIIDDTPLTGITIPIKLMGFLNELQTDEELKGFFGSAEQETTENVSSGSVTENTEAREN